MRRSRFERAGYLFNDNRCSGGKVEEADIIGCVHCHAVILKGPWLSQGAYCSRCDGAVCAECDKNPVCTPMLKQLDDAINDAYRREQNAKVLGI